MKNTEHFKAIEFLCPCCGIGAERMDQLLIDFLEVTRGLFGKPMKIESGFRCEKRNKIVGGVPGSAHTTGEAADILCAFSEDRFNLTRIFLTIGFKRIGIGKNFIHVDISKTLPKNVLWLYGEE